MLFRCLLLIAALILNASLPGTGFAAQASAISGVAVSSLEPIVIGRTHTVNSEALGDERTINVWVPKSQINRRYTVLYVLDGGLDQDFHHIAGLAQLGDLSWTFEPLIVVGVQTRNRRAEMTPPPQDARYVSAFPEAGRAADFRDFLEREVIPLVERNYPTADRRVLAGESLAGLFVIDTLLTRPDLFDDYIAISPSLWWDDQRPAREAAARMSGKEFSSRRLWLAMANEGGTMQAGVDALRQAITARSEKDLVLIYSDYSARETHSTIYHGAMLDALREMYGTPYPDDGPVPWYMVPGAVPRTEP